MLSARYVCQELTIDRIKVVLINKVVLGGRKKGNGNEPYFWVQNLWVHRLARPNPGNWEWPGQPVYP